MAIKIFNVPNHLNYHKYMQNFKSPHDIHKANIMGNALIILIIININLFCV